MKGRRPLTLLLTNEITVSTLKVLQERRTKVVRTLHGVCSHWGQVAAPWHNRLIGTYVLRVRICVNITRALFRGLEPSQMGRRGCLIRIVVESNHGGR